MKRSVFMPLVIVLLIAGAGLSILHRVSSHARQAAAWLPAGTILFEDIPDIHRSGDRWPATALSKIINEPEIQAFLQRPLATMPARAEIDKRLAQVRAVDPTRLFIALTAVPENGAPKMIVGVSYAGSKTDLQSLVDELRKAVQQLWPAGKSDIEKYGSGEIETFSTPSFTAGLCWRGPWLFVSSDLALLKSALDRYDAKPAADSLAELPAFKESLKQLPAAPDNILFIQPKALADRIGSMALMLNPTADVSQMEAIKQVEAVTLAFKMDGEVMRDAAFVIEPNPGDTTPLAKDALKLSSSETILATCERLPALGALRLPDAKDDPSGILQMFDSYLKAFTDQGLGLQQLQHAFGPEAGFVLSWPAASMIPTPLLMADVRDQAEARKFLDTLPTLSLSPGVAFAHLDDGGISFYTLPQTGIGLFPLQVTLGVTGKCVIGALGMDAVRQAAGRWDAGTPGLQATDSFKKAAALVQEPTMAFTYIDAKAIFDHVYGLFRGIASMGFVPHLADYVDIGKLPAPETISRHLAPVVASSAVKNGGLLLESAGPVTTTQAGIVGGAAAAAAAIPLIEQQLKGQSVSIPGFPGIGGSQGSPGFNPFGNPLNQGGSAVPPAVGVPPTTPPPAASATP